MRSKVLDHLVAAILVRRGHCLDQVKHIEVSMAEVTLVMSTVDPKVTVSRFESSSKFERERCRHRKCRIIISRSVDNLDNFAVTLVQFHVHQLVIERIEPWTGRIKSVTLRNLFPVPMLVHVLSRLADNLTAE